MATNIYVFWKETSDPPSPWTRLTRQGRYVRFTDAAGNHLSQVGAATHNHGSMSSFTCGTGNDPVQGSDYSNGFALHAHAEPSWTISSNNNDPPYYGLDIIYMDLAAWEANECRFPDGAVIMSYQALTTDATLARFTAADGKFIMNTTPGATGGNTNTKNHTCQGTTGSSGSGDYDWTAGGTNLMGIKASHNHAVSLASNSVYTPPRQLVTRLYEALAQTLNAQAGSVVFCDGSPGSNWEILTGWKDANLMPGDSNPTLSGSDTHTQSISGNSGSYTSSTGTGNGAPYNNNVPKIHYHAITATLQSASHVPQSTLLVPMRLKVGLKVSIAASARAQLIGLTW